jgi:hypothetical protein
MEISPLEQDEIWETIKGYPGSFVSNLGRIKGPRKYRKFYKNPSGYYLVNMFNGVACRTEYVHHLVANTFIDNPECLKNINHINGLKIDNRLINLERCSASDNIKHAYRTKLKAPVIKSGKPKLDKMTADVIRVCHKDGLAVAHLATYFNVDKTNIYHILNNITWKN